MKKIEHLIFFLLFLTFQAQAWELDPTQSSGDFVSIKNSAFGESHTFGELTGDIDGGTATVKIVSSSVDTKIEIRDDRMRKHLFVSQEHPLITISADVEEVLGQLKISTSTGIELPISVSLRGLQETYTANVRATLVDESLLYVSSVKPVLVGVSDFKLGDGVAMLAKLAGGIQIAESIPVSFSLVFTK